MRQPHDVKAILVLSMQLGCLPAGMVLRLAHDREILSDGVIVDRYRWVEGLDGA